MNLLSRHLTVVYMSKLIFKTSVLNATGDRGINADSEVAHWFKKDIATIAAKIILDSDF